MSKDLGISFATANSRLQRDLLWKYIVMAGHNNCYHCEKEMTRENFSIEHMTPWRNEDNAIDLFFDLDNISFSHTTCNSQFTRANKNIGLVHGTMSGYNHHRCRCALCKKAKADYKRMRGNSAVE